MNSLAAALKAHIERVGNVVAPEPKAPEPAVHPPTIQTQVSLRQRSVKISSEHWLTDLPIDMLSMRWIEIGMGPGASASMAGSQIRICNRRTISEHKARVAAEAWFAALAEFKPQPQWVISSHAIERYKTRFEPRLSYEDVIRDLHVASEFAAYSGVLVTGERLYLLSRQAGHVGYILSADVDAKGRPTLVTVYDGDEARRRILRVTPEAQEFRARERKRA